MQGPAEQQLAELRSWIVSRYPDCGDIGPDTDLLEEVLIDSLEFVSFLMFVEDLRGSPIAAEDIDRESFRTLRGIRESFLVVDMQGEVEG